MSQQTGVMTPLERQQQRRGRILGATVMLVVLLPMLIAYVVFYTGIGMPTVTVNKGDLFTPPQQANELDLRQLDGTLWQVDEHRKKWRWLIPGGGKCAETCQQNLYLTRQVHIRLAEKSTRVERIYLLLDDELSAETQTFLAVEHPHLQILKVDQARLQSAMMAGGLSESSLADGRYFLMDQEGFIMMSYTPQHQGKELLDDIKRMLKYSYEE